MLSFEIKAEVMRKYAKWIARQVDRGDRLRASADMVFDGMLEMLRYMERPDASFQKAFKLIDEADDDFRKRHFTPRKLKRWIGMIKGINIIISCYATDCVAYRRYNENKTHFYLLTDGHY